MNVRYKLFGAHQKSTASHTAPPHPSPHTSPSHFSPSRAATGRYANRVLAEVGLVLTVYRIVEIGDSKIHTGDGAAHVDVVALLMVFAPQVGEVLRGKIKGSDRTGLKISLGFFDDVKIPPYLLSTPCHFDEEEKIWVWDHPAQEYFMDLDETINFRVNAVNYAKVSPSAGLRGFGAKEGAAAVMAIIGTCQGDDGLGLADVW